MDAVAPQTSVIAHESPPSYVIPAVECPVEPRINTHYPVIRRQHAEWVYKNFGAPTGGRPHGSIERMDSLYDASVFPEGIAERVAEHACILTIVFECDDLSLVDPTLCEQIVSGDSKAHAARVLDELWKTIRRHAPSEGVYRRLYEAWTTWFGYLIVENEVRASWQEHDMDSYLHSRERSSGMYAYAAAIEYVHNIDAAEVVSDPDTRRVVYLTGLHCALVNDLYSYGVEYHLGDAVNAINILRHRSGQTVQQAVDTISDLLRSTSREVSELVQRLHRRYAAHPLGDKARAYLDGYLYMLAGNVQWHLETPRYHGRGHVWDGRRSLQVNVASSPQGKLEGAGTPATSPAGSNL